MKKAALAEYFPTARYVENAVSVALFGVAVGGCSDKKVADRQMQSALQNQVVDVATCAPGNKEKLADAAKRFGFTVVESGKQQAAAQERVRREGKGTFKKNDAEKALEKANDKALFSSELEQIAERVATMVAQCDNRPTEKAPRLDKSVSALDTKNLDEAGWARALTKLQADIAKGGGIYAEADALFNKLEKERRAANANTFHFGAAGEALGAKLAALQKDRSDQNQALSHVLRKGQGRYDNSFEALVAARHPSYTGFKAAEKTVENLQNQVDNFLHNIIGVVTRPADFSVVWGNFGNYNILRMLDAMDTLEGEIYALRGALKESKKNEKAAKDTFDDHAAKFVADPGPAPSANTSTEQKAAYIDNKTMYEGWRAQFDRLLQKRYDAESSSRNLKHRIESLRGRFSEYKDTMRVKVRGSVEYANRLAGELSEHQDLIRSANYVPNSGVWSGWVSSLDYFWLTFTFDDYSTHMIRRDVRRLRREFAGAAKGIEIGAAAIDEQINILRGQTQSFIDQVAQSSM